MPSRFLYPRTVTVRRPTAQTGVGSQAYGGLSPNAETVITSFVCSIQLAGQPGNPTGLPSGVNASDYRVYNRQLARGIVQDRDVLVDDLGWRYKVIAAYWDSLGPNIYARKLEV